MSVYELLRHLMVSELGIVKNAEECCAINEMKPLCLDLPTGLAIIRKRSPSRSLRSKDKNHRKRAAGQA
jgi:hypothetical protein